MRAAPPWEQSQLFPCTDGADYGCAGLDWIVIDIEHGLNKEAVEGAKRQAWNREEVERGDYLAVVREKGQPALRSALIPTNVLVVKITRSRGLGNLEAELKQFAVNARVSLAN